MSAEDNRKKSKQNDPLYGGAEEKADEEVEDRVFTSREEIGFSTAGRNKWKLRHGKGKFSKKSLKKSGSIGVHSAPGGGHKKKKY